MTKLEILNKLKELKPYYEKEGFILLGLFGSYARDEAKDSSDIDIAYKIEPQKFTEINGGFSSFSRIFNIKNELKNIFKKDVDLSVIDGNSETFKKFALKDMLYV